LPYLLGSLLFSTFIAVLLALLNLSLSYGPLDVYGPLSEPLSAVYGYYRYEDEFWSNVTFDDLFLTVFPDVDFYDFFDLSLDFFDFFLRSFLLLLPCLDLGRSMSESTLTEPKSDFDWLVSIPFRRLSIATILSVKSVLWALDCGSSALRSASMM